MNNEYQSIEFTVLQPQPYSNVNASMVPMVHTVSYLWFIFARTCLREKLEFMLRKDSSPADIFAFSKIDIFDIFHLLLHILACLNHEEHILSGDKLF